MLRTRTALLSGLAFLALPLVLRPTAYADDPAAPTEPPKEAPKKAETDDASIFADWKLCKQRGTKHCRDRAEFWTTKGTLGKDLVWLGKMWARGEDHQKAVAAFEKFLEFEPAKTDEKAVEINTKNRPLARRDLIDSFFALREWDKSIAAAEKFRADYADSPVAAETWDDQGRANRLKGDDAKAVECFEKAADKMFRAFLDIIDVHLCNGDVEKANAAVAKFGGAFDKKNEMPWLKDMLAAIGTPAPALDVAVGVAGEPAKTYEKPMVFFHWSVQSTAVDKKLGKLEMLRRSNSEKMNAIGIATYKKYNMETRKLESELTEEQEAALIRKFWEQGGDRLTPCAMVPQAFLDALKIRWDGQMTIVDAAGKLRYARLNEEKPYDIAAIEFVIKKLAESPATPK